MTRLYLRTLATPAALLFAACGKEPEPEPLPEQPMLAPGAACDPDDRRRRGHDDPEDDKDPQAVCAARPRVRAGHRRRRRTSAAPRFEVRGRVRTTRSPASASTAP
jgi:hypothetical protein